MAGTDPIADLIGHLAKLPGIGEKTASRLAFHIMNAPEAYAQALSQALLDVKHRVRLCSVCCNLTEKDPCEVCSSTRRERGILCVVERVPDLRAIEATGEYRGLYHVLHGVLSPLEGIGPDDIRLKELVARLHDRKDGGEPIREIIVATNPTTDGETTALYLSKLLKPFDLKLSRIAFGIPMGGDLEYIDKVTLSRALAGRRDL
jgi:recombination protein RecR